MMSDAFHLSTRRKSERQFGLMFLKETWLRFSEKVGRTINFVLLGFFYYFAVAPVGLFVRLFKVTDFTRGFERERKSYWIRKEDHFESDRMRRQF